MPDTRTEVLQHIRQVGLVPVLRAPSEDIALRTAEAMLQGGCPIVELTMTVPNAVRLLAPLAQRFPEMLVGAGTVLDPETARLCILEGARFIVSPATNLDTIAVCRRYSVAVLPGALTPTEVVAAWQAGADAVKIFPASAMGGAPYLRALRAPLPHVELIPTGGVSLTTAADFLQAGALALGVGADLADATAIAASKPDIVIEKTRQYLEIVRDFHRNQQPA